MFWEIAVSDDFESAAKEALLKLLKENSAGNVEKLVSGYQSHLRRFRLFLASDGKAQVELGNNNAPKNTPRSYRKKKNWGADLPRPCPAQVEYYLEK